MTPGPDPLARRARATPNRTAVVEAGTGTAVRFDDLADRAGELAAGFAGLGLAPGDHLGLLAPTSADAVTGIHAAWRLGLRLVPLDVRLPDDEIRKRAERADVDALACVEGTAGAAASVAAGPVVSLDDGGLPGGVEPIGAVERAAAEPAEWRDEDAALSMFTSGTTGEPKAVTLTMGNLTASATASAFRLGVRPSDRWLLCLPVYHMGGLAPVLRTALYGTTLVVQAGDGGFDAAAVARATDEHDVTGLSLVPTQLERILSGAAELAGSVRAVLLGGAPAPRAVIERCERRDVPVYPTYGLTETASQVATATPEQAIAHPGTVGQPLLGVDVTVVDEELAPLPAGATGEVVVDGPTVTPGYYDDPAATERAFCEHGLRTGDVGRLDEAGRLWVTGRLDDRIVTGGENVQPAAVADALRSHPDVADAAVVGLDDPEWGQRVAALVVADDGAETGADLEDAIVEHCRERLAGYQVPKIVGFAGDIPRTASGTVDRAAVRRMLAGRG